MFNSPKAWRFALAACSTLLLSAASLTAQHYTRTDLTHNEPGVSPTAVNVDPNLVNAWGLSRGATSFWWVSDTGTGLATLYDAAGLPQSLVVTIPPPEGQNGPSTPTGQAFNFTGAFEIAPGAPAIFLFVTEDGTISGWNPGVNPTNAVIKVNRYGKAIYKGVTVAMTKKGPRLYATNFLTGRVEVYDGKFQRIHTDEHAFRSRFSRDFVPFGIQNVGGNIVVTFAKRAHGQEEELHGPGLGKAVIFDPFGNTLQRLQHGPWMNAPWGIAMSPGDFGAFSHRLLIGNFGDGTIHAFDPVSGQYDGTVLDAATNQPIVIDGLWALQFGGNAPRNGLGNELFFTAGPNEEADGLFGKLAAVATEQRGTSE